MRILAIESSGMTASVAYMEDERLLGEYTIDYKKTHSQTLLPMLDALTSMLGLEADRTDAIAVSAGPGSFTGLRIGSATAKGLGLAWGKPLIAVPTVDALAYNLYDVPGLIVPMMDARRAEVYTGFYRFRAHEMTAEKAQCAMAVDAVTDELNVREEPVTFLGDGAQAYMDRIRGRIRVPFSVAPPHLNRQRAGAVAALAEVYYAAGNTISADAFHPIYLRQTQAEREQPERGQQMRELEKSSARLKPADYGADDSYE